MRRFFSGPGILNSDLALLKDTKLAESKSLQFRAETFNVSNHAQFNNPSGNFNNAGTGLCRLRSRYSSKAGRFKTGGGWRNWCWLFL